MTKLSTRDEILRALDAAREEVAGFFLSIPEHGFLDGDLTAWGAAHQLAHLARTHSMVARAFAAGARLQSHPSGRSRPLAELREAYVSGLAAAAPRLREWNPAPPRIEEGASRESLVAAYVAEARRLRAAAETWAEEELDHRAIPHPVLGVLSAREMLLFVLIHDEHHREDVRRKLGARS